MRVDPVLHPFFAHEGSRTGAPAPTRLTGAETLAGHDDYSCLDDAEAAGLLENVGTGANRRYAFTIEGRRVADALRDHLGRSGAMATFRWPRSTTPP